MSANYLLAHHSLPGTDEQSGHSDAIWAVASCETLLLTASADATIKLWNPSSGALPTQTISLPSSLAVVSLALDPNKSAPPSYFIANSIDSALTRYSTAGQLQATKQLPPGNSWSISLSPNEPFHLAVSGSIKSKATVLILSSEIETFGNKIYENEPALEGRGGFGLCVQYSKSGSLLAMSSDTGYVSLFNAAENYALISSFPAHASAIRTLVFTSTLLITGSDDKRINVFDLKSIVSPNSSGSRKGQVASLGGHEGWVCSLAARNDRLLASGSSDGSIKLWDLAALGTSSTAISTLRDHAGDVWALSWLPDPIQADAIDGLGGTGAGIGGGKLVSAGEDAGVRWWRGTGV